MNILIVPSWYPTKENPLHGIFFKEQAEALAKLGNEVSVLCLFLRRRAALKKHPLFIFPVITKYTKNNVNTIIFEWIKFSGNRKLIKFQEKLFFSILYTWYIKKNKRPEIVHAHSLIYAGLNIFRKFTNNEPPFIITEHSSAFIKRFKNDNIKDDVMGAINSSAKTIAVSEVFRKIIIDETNCSPEKIIYIPNMVNTDIFLPDNTKRLDADSFFFSSIGVLKKEKGFDILIKAFKQLIDKGYDIKLQIGGDGDQYLELSNLISSLNLENEITLFGRLNRAEVLQLLQRTNVYTTASYFETFGVSLIEALACGVPVVGTKCGGPESIINEKNGLLVGIKDVDGLAKAMETILNNFSNYNGTEIRKDCISRFSETAVAKQLLKLYSHAVKSSIDNSKI